MKQIIKKIFIASIFILIGIIIGVSFKKENNVLEKNTNVKQKSTISMMLEVNASSGEYEVTNQSE